MAFGTDIGGVRRTRSYTGEGTHGVAKSARESVAQREQGEPVTVEVKATLEGGTYTLAVSADGQSATRRDVEAADLADTLASIIDRLSKAVAAGELRKHRQPQEPTLRGTDFTRARKQDVFSG